MKRTLLLLFVSLLSFTALAQTNDTAKHSNPDSLKFYPVERDPNFPGGLQAFNHFLSKNQKYPTAALKSNIQGKVLITFVIEKDGSLTEIKVLKSLSPETDAEAIRVMQISPKWNPGIQNGRPVRVQYTMPVNFYLTDQ